LGGVLTLPSQPVCLVDWSSEDKTLRLSHSRGYFWSPLPCHYPLQTIHFLVQSSLPNDAEHQRTKNSSNCQWTNHQRARAHLPATSRSAVPEPVLHAARERTDVKERSVDYPPAPSPVPLTASTGPSLPPARNECQAPCRRCQLSGQPCIFEKPEKKNGQLLSTASVECGDVPLSAPFHFSRFSFPHSHRRLSRLEGQYVVGPILLSFLSPPFLHHSQGHAKPNDWPSNLLGPYSRRRHPTRCSGRHASRASYLPSDDP
jgi:hypothetical protein